MKFIVTISRTEAKTYAVKARDRFDAIDKVTQADWGFSFDEDVKRVDDESGDTLSILAREA